MEFRTDGELTLRVRKVTFDGVFSGWEADLTGPDGNFCCEVTGPSFWSAIDGCLEYVNFDEGCIDQDWVSEDANKNDR